MSRNQKPAAVLLAAGEGSMLTLALLAASGLAALLGYTAWARRKGRALGEAACMGCCVAILAVMAASGLIAAAFFAAWGLGWC